MIRWQAKSIVRDWSLMSRTYNVIDADGHVLEPPDLWLSYIEPKFRDRAPRLGHTSDGAEVLQLGEQEVTDNGPGRRRVKVGATGAIGAREGKVSVWIKYAEGRAGGFDPHARIPDMESTRPSFIRAWDYFSVRSKSPS